MGMPQPIPNLEARAAPGFPGLLATATPLNLEVGDRWMAGVSYLDECSAPTLPRTLFPCGPDTGEGLNEADKLGFAYDDGTDTWVDDPSYLNPTRGLTVLGWDEGDEDEDVPQLVASYATGLFVCNARTPREDAAMIARRRLAASLSFQMEVALGLTATTGVELGDGASVMDGLAKLEQAHGRCSGDEATIHASPLLVTMWVGLDLVSRDPSGLLRTALGSRVVAGRGYLAADADDEQVAWVTGPVSYELGAIADPSLEPISSSYTPRENTVAVIVEQPFVLRYPACCVFNIAVDPSVKYGGSGGVDGGSP